MYFPISFILYYLQLSDTRWMNLEDNNLTPFIWMMVCMSLFLSYKITSFVLLSLLIVNIYLIIKEISGSTWWGTCWITYHLSSRLEIWCYFSWYERLLWVFSCSFSWSSVSKDYILYIICNPPFITVIIVTSSFINSLHISFPVIFSFW